MLFLSDTLLLHHAADHTGRLRAEAALRDRVVAARGRRAPTLARLRTRLAHALAALAERLEPRSSTARLDRGNGSAAARG